ncbi:hypothetical protein HII28_19845, partial [Planctomonas sp. JC2975]|nr:hypothetical protein [Planctomonas sp. JC2975]
MRSITWRPGFGSVEHDASLGRSGTKNRSDELDVFAAGYLEAITDQAYELARLRWLVARL